MSSDEPLRSDIAWSNRDKIVVRGYDLTRDLMGHVNLGDMAFLEVRGRLPDAAESTLFNAILVTLVEHGIVPSTLAARLTHAGAPEAMQAAVAAGLLGLGSVFVGSTEGAAKMLAAALEGANGEPLEAIAQRVVAEHRAARRIIPGLGHPVHKPVDPRTLRLFEIAAETGFRGRYVELMERISAAAQQASGRELPVNATGAIGALCCEMGLSWKVAPGLGVMARAVGLVGHVLEEQRRPIAIELWRRAEHEAGEHLRPPEEPE